MYYFMHSASCKQPCIIKRVLLTTIAMSLAALLGACSVGPKAYSIRGDGDKILNRDINGKSLSVVVSIYQLKDAREFSKLTFDTLADGRPEAELLGPALLDKSDVVVVPGGSYVSSEKLLDETRFVGVVAFFRRPDQHYWRQLVDANAIRGPGLTFKVQDCYVTLSGVQAVPLPGQPPNARPECGTANAADARQGVRPASTGYQPAAQQTTTPATTQAATHATTATERGQQRSWLPQSMPDVTVNTRTPIAPIGVRTGSGGVSAISIGETAPAPAPVPAPGYYAPPPGYYGAQPGYYGAPRY